MKYLTLVLSKDFKPLYFTTYKHAFILEYTRRAKVVKYYNINEINIRTINRVFKVPMIIHLSKLKYTEFKAKSPSREAIFYRDNFTCAYCGKQLKLNECTIDHIIPSSKGGQWSWENLVTSCIECNRKKKDTIKYPKYCKPYKPTIFNIQLKTYYNDLHEEIKQYLNENYGPRIKKIVNGI